MADKGCTEAGDQLSFAQVAGKMFWQLHGKQLLSSAKPQYLSIYQSCFFEYTGELKLLTGIFTCIF